MSFTRLSNGHVLVAADIEGSRWRPLSNKDYLAYRWRRSHPNGCDWEPVQLSIGGGLLVLAIAWLITQLRDSQAYGDALEIRANLSYASQAAFWLGVLLLVWAGSKTTDNLLTRLLFNWRLKRGGVAEVPNALWAAWADTCREQQIAAERWNLILRYPELLGRYYTISDHLWILGDYATDEHKARAEAAIRGWAGYYAKLAKQSLPRTVQRQDERAYAVRRRQTDNALAVPQVENSSNVVPLAQSK